MVVKWCLGCQLVGAEREGQLAYYRPMAWFWLGWVLGGRWKFQMPFAKFYRRGDVSWELHSRNKGGFFEAPGSGDSGTEWEVIGWTGGRKRFITEKGKCARMIRGAN